MIIVISILLLKNLIKSIAGNFAVRLKQGNLATKADIDDFAEMTDFDVKLKNLNKKFTSNKTT